MTTGHEPLFYCTCGQGFDPVDWPECPACGVDVVLVFDEEDDDA